ncbi:MAG TPA: histidine kinase dimerization/phospho-acceptor domain-containing protein, partial [Nitrospiria bacterium]
MFRTLNHKLAAVLLILFLLIGVLFIWLSFFSTRMHIQEVNQKFNRTLAEQLVSKNLLFKDGRANDQALKDIFNTLMVINPAIEIYLLDTEGKILAYSAPPGKVKQDRISLKPLEKFMAKTPAFPILGDDPRNPGGKKIFSAAPVLIPQTGDSAEIPGGYLYVILGGEEYDSVAGMLRGSYILKQSFWIAGAGLLFALFSGLILFNLLTRRLRLLTRRMEAFQRQDVPNKGPVHPSRRGDEIDQMNTTFIQMSERIHSQMTTLRETDTLRRELVANVSHDLRTPLASLQGYLETLLLKEGTLSPREKQHYLEIALRHSERLGKLVSELFELAKLDSRESPPKIEAFSLAELVQDVAQKFQLAAGKKGIRLKTDVRADIPFVSADIGLIERVLENLIEN